MAGLLAGSIYALVAIAIVLIYRTTRILNVAIGELAAFGLLVSWTLVESWRLSWTLAVPGSIAAVVVVGLGFERIVARPLREAPPLSGLVATAGLATLLLGVEGKLWSADGRFFTDFLTLSTINIGGVFVTGWEIASIFVSLGLSLGVMAFLQRTRFGLAIRATADDLDAARSLGIPVDRVSATVWAAAGCLAAVAGLLLRPTIGFIAPGLLTGLFVRGLAGALIGRLWSTTAAFFGGIAIGLLESATAYVFLGGSFEGARSLAVLLVVVIALLLRPLRVLGTAA